MIKGQFAQQFFAAEREVNIHLAPIAVAPASLDQLPLHQPVDQPYHTVVAQLHTLGQVADADPLLLDQTSQCEKKLILPRFDTSFSRSFFTQPEEVPNAVA